METYFQIKDFYSAIILRTQGIPLIKLEKEKSSFVTFFFDAERHICERILSDFWDRKLQIEPRRFIENINELKTRIHEVLANH